jgi:hypothetical protein
MQAEVNYRIAEISIKFFRGRRKRGLTNGPFENWETSIFEESVYLSILRLNVNL